MDVANLAEIAVLLWLRRCRRRHRTRVWVHEVDARRPEFGSFGHLFPGVVIGQDEFYFFKMTTDQFKMLVELNAPTIRKQNKNMCSWSISFQRHIHP